MLNRTDEIHRKEKDSRPEREGGTVNGGTEVSTKGCCDRTEPDKEESPADVGKGLGTQLANRNPKRLPILKPCPASLS